MIIKLKSPFLLLLMPWLAWAGPIELNVSSIPSQLKTAFNYNVKDVKLITTVACYNLSDGSLLNCSYDFGILGLAGDQNDIAVNAGHTHDYAAHPLGKASSLDGSGNKLVGQTKNTVVKIVHTLPIVSGRIQTRLDLTVPPGWYCVSPECFDSTRSGWRFNTTLDVGVNGLSFLPNPAANSGYTKLRNPDTKHTNANAYYGSKDTQFYLPELAKLYQLLSGGKILSVNDMSLPRGGLFDANGDWVNPHVLHRIGTSADINRTNGDCLTNKTLKQATDLLMPPFSRIEITRGWLDIWKPDSSALPSHFRCETGNHNRIHIDFDMTSPQ